MKKTVALILTVVLLLCVLPSAAFAEAEDDAVATFAFLAAASSGKEALSRHTNIKTKRSVFLNEEEAYDENRYIDKDIWLMDNSITGSTLGKVDLWLELDRNEEDPHYLETIFENGEEAVYAFETIRDRAFILFDEGNETVLETVDKGDGRLTIITEITDPEQVEQLMAGPASLGSYAYSEGITLRFEYTFDTESADILGADSFVIDAAGDEHSWMSENYAYDVEPYDPAAEGEPFSEYYAAIADPEQSHTTTVTFYPGEENEHSVTHVTPNYSFCAIWKDGDYVEFVYADRECTQPYEGSDGETDIELFVK